MTVGVGDRLGVVVGIGDGLGLGLGLGNISGNGVAVLGMYFAGQISGVGT